MQKPRGILLAESVSHLSKLGIFTFTGTNGGTWGDKKRYDYYICGNRERKHGNECKAKMIRRDPRKLLYMIMSLKLFSNFCIHMATLLQND
ncbi:MAG: zinc ribbon domain-containing protein, partial [Syntrophomonas sp.]